MEPKPNPNGLKPNGLKFSLGLLEKFRILIPASVNSFLNIYRSSPDEKGQDCRLVLLVEKGINGAIPGAHLVHYYQADWLATRLLHLCCSICNSQL